MTDEYLERKYLRYWTAEQWDDAQRTEDEITAMLGEDGYPFELVCLVIEERKRFPDTTVEDTLKLAVVLGVESLLELRHGAFKDAGRTGCAVSPDVAVAKRCERQPRKSGAREKRGVRGV